MSSQSEFPYWSQLLSIVAIIIACWWLSGSVVSAQLRIWLLGSSSLMSSNEGNLLTFISRWSSLASASTSRILRTLLAYVSGHLVTSHWPLLPIYVWIMLYTSTSIQSSSSYSLDWWQKGIGSSCKIQFLYKLGHILLFVLLYWGYYPHWSHNIDLLVLCISRLLFSMTTLSTKFMVAPKSTKTSVCSFVLYTQSVTEIF